MVCMTEQLSHQETSKGRVEALYPEYMEMIRTFVSEGILEIEEPTDPQKQWAQKASLGNPELAKTFGYLAQLTEQAHKQRYLEGMPMLIDTKDGCNEPFIDLPPIDRFHFLRMLVKDQNALASTPAEPEMGEVPKVLYMTPLQDDSFEQASSI